MVDNRNRKRPIQVKFFVNAAELEMIKKRMTDLGMDNLSAYLRNMALGGAYALRELVKAVYVEAPDKSSGKRKQKIHISYDLIGFIPVDVLTKAEQA